MRGFSLIEVLIAITLAATGVTAAALIAFGTPVVLENARLEMRAYRLASELLSGTERSARESFALVLPVATSSDDGLGRALAVEYLSDDLAARLTARVNWIDARGEARDLALQSLVTDPGAALEEVCSPIVTGSSAAPERQGSYSLTSDDLLPGVPGRYVLSDLVATRERLVIAAASTESSTDPALFAFDLGAPEVRPVFRGSYDNAPSSRVGFAAVAQGQGHIYAANAFGSASAATCSTTACAQLQVFDTEGLELKAALQLPKDAPPYAVSAGGVSTPAKSILYRKGFVYLGLEKTAAGHEFSIIDVRNPLEPRWIGSAPVGRSVNDIAVSGTVAYLATSDSGKELVVVDVADPSAPRIIGSRDFPGTLNFGLGNAVTLKNGTLYFGRTYSPNAPEWYVLNTELRELGAQNPGTTARPETVHAILVRDFLAFVLTGKRFEVWKQTLEGLERAAEVPLNGTGAALTCRGTTFYIGANDAVGAGLVEVLSSS